eukprot:g45992.t1
MVEVCLDDRGVKEWCLEKADIRDAWEWNIFSSEQMRQRLRNWENVLEFWQDTGWEEGILSFLSAPLIGALSDVWGRKSFLLLTVFFTCAPIPLMRISPWWYFAVISMSGVFAVTFSVIFAYVADITQEHERSTAYGLGYSLNLTAPQLTSPNRCFDTVLGDIISEASDEAIFFYSAWNLYCPVRC